MLSQFLNIFTFLYNDFVYENMYIFQSYSLFSLHVCFVLVNLNLISLFSEFFLSLCVQCFLKS